MKKDNFLLKIFIVLGAAAAFIIVSWITIFYEVDNYKNNTLNGFKDQQYLTVSQLSERVHEAYLNYTKDNKLTSNEAEEKIIQEILKKEDNTENRYVFFYSSDNGVLFERNNTDTAKYKGKSIKQVFDIWRYNGGTNLDAAQKTMNQGISGSERFTKESGYGSEIVSWCFFNESQHKYIVGMCTSESYIVRTTFMDEHILRIYGFGAVSSAAIAALSILLALSIYLNYNRIHKIGKDLSKKNMEIEELTLKVQEMENIAKNAVTYDGLTNTYNKDFFYTMIKDIDKEMFLPIAVIRGKLNDLKSIDEVFGRSKCDDILKQTGALLLKNSGETRIVSRISDDEFAMIMLNTDKEAAYELINSIKSEMEKSFGEYLCTMAFGVSIKSYCMENLLKTLEMAKVSEIK